MTFTSSGVNYQVLVSREGRRDTEFRLEDILPDRTTWTFHDMDKRRKTGRKGVHYLGHKAKK